MNIFLDLKEKINTKLLQNLSFEKVYNRGIDYYSKKLYDKALVCFKFAIEKQNVKPIAYYNLGLTYQCLKDFDKAITAYNKFLTKCPTDCDGLYNLALIYYFQGKYQKAVDLVTKSKTMKPDEENIKLLTISLLSLGDEDSAHSLAEEMLADGVKESFATAVAKGFEEKNNLSKDYKYLDYAQEIYQKITEKTPNYYDAYLSISICYAKKGEWENSVKYCQHALQINPTSYEVNNQMGLVLYCSGDIANSVRFYEQAFKIKPENESMIYSSLAYAYEKNGDLTKAKRMFKELLKKFPNYAAKDEIKKHFSKL